MPFRTVGPLRATAAYPQIRCTLLHGSTRMWMTDATSSASCCSRDSQYVPPTDQLTAPGARWRSRAGLNRTIRTQGVPKGMKLLG